MENGSGGAKALLTHYLTLRRAIGVLGILFPLLLWLGALLVFRVGLQKSISAYYHTGMGDVFVGTLCVIGFFLRAYRGYERLETDKWLTDNAAGNLACVFAVGVALFPPKPDGVVSLCVRIVGIVHWTFAGLFFLTLIYFSLYQFTKTKSKGKESPRKRKRNWVYRVCGWTMFGCIVLIGIHAFFPKSFLEVLRPIFVLETAAVVAFGVSWLTKGKVLRMNLFTRWKKI